MAVAVMLEFPGGTLEGYDRVLERLGLDRDHGVPGLMFHWCAATDRGLRVVDVWRDRDVAEAFVRDRLVPATREEGVLDAPEIQVLDVHGILRED